MSRARTIDDVFARAAREVPRAIHLVLPDGGVIPYEETYQRARQLAGAMRAAGIVKGDRVAAFMRNSREIIEVYVASGIAGAITVAINGMSSAREVERICADCTPAGIVVEGRFLDRVSDSAAAGMRLQMVTKGGPDRPGWQGYDDLLATSPPADPLPDAAPADAAMMIYSSGTTGAPKGILLRHSALIANAGMTLSVLGLRDSDRVMTILPLFSSFGHAFDFLQAGIVRASTVLLDQFDEARAVDCIERLGVTFLAGVPTMFARMFDAPNIAGRDLSSLRLIDVGGGPVSARLKQMLRQELGVEVVESYGLTEISPVASVQVPFADNPLGSCGPPLPGVEVRAIRLDGRPAAVGEPGELQFRSETFMIGYWNQPELTASTLADGWLRSGDVGRLDERGHIHILDRTKDMIVTNGFNVYPKEVENVIAELPAVQSVAVVGVPDEIAGELIHAFVVQKTGHVVSPAEVIAHCATELSRYKVPKGVSVVDALPLTASGKIRRVALREMLKGRKAQERSA